MIHIVRVDGFFLSKQMELLEVLKSHQVMLNVERTAVKRYILLQVISQKYSKSFFVVLTFQF